MTTRKLEAMTQCAELRWRAVFDRRPVSRLRDRSGDQERRRGEPRRWS